MPHPKKEVKRVVKAWAIVSKYNNEIMEAYHDFEMNDTYSSLKGARMYIKKIFTKKAWPNYQKDIKVIPCTITYNLPHKSP